MIDPLCELVDVDDFLLGWWSVFCRYCAGEPVLYVARYYPSEHLCAVAAEYNVLIVPVPLRLIPAAALRRVQEFRFLWLTEEQWNLLDPGPDPASLG